MNKKLGFSSLLLAAVTYGSFGVWIKLLSKEMGMYEQIVLRNVISFVMAICVVLIWKRYKVDLKRVSKKYLLLYAITVPVAVIFYNIGILNLKIAVATFTFYMANILSSELIGLIYYKEKLTISRIVALVLVAIGLGFFVFPLSKEVLSVGFLACIVSGFLDATSNGFRKHLAGKMDKFMLVSITAVGGILVSGLMIFQAGQNLNFLGGLSSTSWIIGLLFGFLLLLINYLLLVGFQNFEMGPGVIVLSTELLFALIFGLVAFGEMPMVKELIGGLFILAASIAPNVKWRKEISKE